MCNVKFEGLFGIIDNIFYCKFSTNIVSSIIYTNLSSWFEIRHDKLISYVQD